MIKQSLLFLFILLSIAHVTIAGSDIPTSKIQLENFKTLDSKHHIIDVTDGVYTVAQIHFGKQPEDIHPYLDAIYCSSVYDIGNTSQSGKITVSLEEELFNDATLIVFLDESRELVGYIGLMRQSETHLLNKFNFTKNNGYTVIGRTSRWFLPNKTYQLVWRADPVYTYPDLRNYYPREQYPREIREIIALMRFFWKEPMQTGPSNNDYTNLPADVQIDFLESGQWTIQCGEIRDIVAAYAIQSHKIPGVKIVNAAQYYPRFRDLVGNEHGVMEIYSPYYQKWILVDPMFGKLFTYNGEYINTDDILALSIEERKNIVPIKVAGNAVSLGEVFNGYYLNQNYYTYYNTVSEKLVKFQTQEFEKMYCKSYVHDLIGGIII